MKPSRPPLTGPQRTLLVEIEAAGTLYVRAFGRYGRTVQALVTKGYVVISEPDYSRRRADGYSVAPGPEDHARP